jgi:uncharacterized lipoprotein
MKKQFVWLLVATILLSGCQQVNKKRSQYVRNFAQDYLNTSLIAPLKIPEGMAQPEVTENYPLPENIPAPGSVTPPSLTPPGFAL